MSQEIPRRPLLIALGAILGVGVVGGGLYEAALFGPRPHSVRGYDDLLSGLGDRDLANKLGVAVLEDAETFDIGPISHELRKHIAHRPLPAVLAGDLAE